MLKRKIFYIILFFISCYSTKLYPNINIVLKIEDEIITNRDIQKEIGYLKTLNPKLKQLNNNQICLKITKTKNKLCRLPSVFLWVAPQPKDGI